eukprot:COSAG06_NODE_42_length_29897_cov_42.547721_22_plen_770_part_00
MCDRTIAAGLYDCDTDYCLTCPQAHSCDNSCSLPCGETEDGHRRNLKSNSTTTDSMEFELQLSTTLIKLNKAAASSSRKSRRLQDYWQATPETNDALFDVAPINQIACPLSSFVDRAQEVEAQCCHGGRCPNGMPDDCAFDCGRFFTSFMVDCNQTIHNNFDRLTLAEYVAFGDECSRMDPMSMVRAIDGAFCTTCGDNITQAPLEQCDWGADNSYEPNACRPDCQLPSCGDGVIDTVYSMGRAQPICSLDDAEFTTLGTTGNDGPTSTAGYAGTSLDGVVTLVGGIQTMEVSAGQYNIEIAGAEGGTSKTKSGGHGAIIHAIVTLPSGVLKVLVGQRGSDTDGNDGYNAGGGGGTFVWVDDGAIGPVAVAGGGGGASADAPVPGGDAQLGENGGTCPTGSCGTAGTSGHGGTSTGGSYPGNPGAGWLTGGTGGGGECGGNGANSQAPREGGRGSPPDSDGGDGFGGGFGGGGGGQGGCNDSGGGGGGGYSGGAAVQSCCTVPGGGGGSFIQEGGEIISSEATNTGDGWVRISCAGPPPAELCDDGVANSDGGSCRNDCTRSCSRPPPVDGMTVSLTAGLAPGSVATFSCDIGQTGGPLTCQADGSWSSEPPTGCILCTKPDECQDVVVDDETYTITLTESKEESCNIACADVGLDCNEEQLVRLATYAKASDATYLSFIQDQPPAGLGLSGPTQATQYSDGNGHGFFGIGCSNGEWFFHGFSSDVDTCTVQDAKYDDRTRASEARCDYTYSNGGNEGNFYGPSICTCT